MKARKMGNLAAFATAAALSLSLMACASSASSYSQETLTDVSGVKVEAENASKDSMTTSEDALEVKEGEVIIVSPLTEKGGFHVTITPSQGGSPIYDQDVTGSILFPVEAEPGSYSITITPSGKNVTGELTVFATNADEYASVTENSSEIIQEVREEANEASADTAASPSN